MEKLPLGETNQNLASLKRSRLIALISGDCKGAFTRFYELSYQYVAWD